MRAMLQHLSTVRVSTFYIMVSLAYAVVGFVCGFLFKIDRIDVWEHVSDRGVSLPVGILLFPSFHKGFIMVPMTPVVLLRNVTFTNVLLCFAFPVLPVSLPDRRSRGSDT